MENYLSNEEEKIKKEEEEAIKEATLKYQRKIDAINSDEKPAEKFYEAGTKIEISFPDKTTPELNTPKESAQENKITKEEINSQDRKTEIQEKIFRAKEEKELLEKRREFLLEWIKNNPAEKVDLEKEEEPKESDEIQNEELILKKFEDEKSNLGEKLYETKIELSKIPWWKPIKKIRLSKELDKYRKSISKIINDEENYTEKQEKIKAEKEIKKDKEIKPFAYFVASKITDPDTITSMTNPYTKSIDLRYLENDQAENFNRTRNYIFATKYNKIQNHDDFPIKEGFFDFNVFGFTKIIKNVEQTLKKNEGSLGNYIDTYSPEAIYKIVGPDGSIIADDVKGYDEATRIYNEATKKYIDEMEELFKNSQKK